MIIKMDKVLGYQYRIRELEEILCPAESHAWKQAGFYFAGGTGIGDETTMYRYVCRKCKKRMELIHPMGRFYVAEFTFGRGTIRECFTEGL